MPPKGLYRYSENERVPQPEKAEKATMGSLEQAEEAEEMVWKQAEDRIISRVHAKVEDEFGRAETSVAKFCRTEADKLTREFMLSDDEKWDLINTCDNEARKWAKADVQEWMKGS